MKIEVNLSCNFSVYSFGGLLPTAARRAAAALRSFASEPKTEDLIQGESDRPNIQLDI